MGFVEEHPPKNNSKVINSIVELGKFMMIQ